MGAGVGIAHTRFLLGLYWLCVQLQPGMPVTRSILLKWKLSVLGVIKQKAES
jgi:hypothetical protein